MKKVKKVAKKEKKATVEEKPEASAEGLELRKMAEEMLNMPDKELMELMPAVIPGVKDSVMVLLAAMPDLPQKLAERLSKSDVKKWATEAPAASDAFTDLLWAVTSAMVERNKEFKKAVEGAGEIKVNYEATDSPMKGHYHISGGKIIGGPGNLNSVDLTVKSNTDVLVKLVTGGLDPIKGLMTRKFKLDGPLALGMKLAVVMKEMANVFKGQ
jgi:putative sterol carrier protein